MKKNKDIKISVLIGIIIIVVVTLVTIPLFYNQFNSSMMLLKDKTINEFRDEEKIAQIFISSKLKIRSSKLSEYVKNKELIQRLEEKDYKSIQKLMGKGIRDNLDSDFIFLTYDGIDLITDLSLNIFNNKRVQRLYVNNTPFPDSLELFITPKNNVIIFAKEDIISVKTGKVLATLHSGHILNNKNKLISGLSEKINNHNVYFFANNKLVSGTQEISKHEEQKISETSHNQLIQVNSKLFYIGSIEINGSKNLKVVLETSSNYIENLQSSYVFNFILIVLISISLCLISMLLANKIITPPLERLLETINLLMIRNIRTHSKKSIIKEFNLIEDNFINVFEQFQKKKSQLAKFINSSSTSVLIIDYKGNIIQTNQAAIELLEITRTNGNILLDSTLKNSVQFRNIFLSIKEKRNSFEEEINFKNDSEWKNTTWSFTQDKSEDYIFIQCTDNTEKVETQAQIEAERSKSIHNQKLAAIGEVASSIAHEVNNPMGIISLSLTILEHELSFVDIENEDKKRKISSSISNIENAVNRTSQIVSNLLDFSREGSKDKLESKNLNTIISKTLIFIEEKIKKNKVHLDISNLDTSINILVKETQFSQILINLINNSIDALKEKEERTIIISTEIKDKNCIIHFEDTGHGIPKDIEKEIFSPFYTTKSKGSGTGLGLSISKDLMLEMSGNLKVVSTDLGAHFEVSIPLGHIN